MVRNRNCGGWLGRARDRLGRRAPQLRLGCAMLDPLRAAKVLAPKPAGELVKRARWLRLWRCAGINTEIIDAGRHHRDADDAFEAVVERGADDDVGVGIDLLANAGRGFVDLEQREVPS